MQARKQDFKINWDPVEFNKVIRDSLLAYNLITHTSEQVLMRKNAVIQREIPAKRITKGLLLGVPKQVKEITNVDSLKYARSHTMERVENGKRRECISCKIRGRFSRPGGAGRSVLRDITNKASKGVKYAAKA